jgi:hypothetical protein
MQHNTQTRVVPGPLALRRLLAPEAAGIRRARDSAESPCIALTAPERYPLLVSESPSRPSITRATKLSEVRRLLSARKPTEGRARMVRSIQQSMRVEGYEVSTEVIAHAVDKVFRSRRNG